MFFQETAVGIFTGTILANNDYICPRLNTCPSDSTSYPWFVPPFFVTHNGSYTVRDVQYKFDGMLAFPINKTIFFVPKQKYNERRYPLHQFVKLDNPVFTVTGPVVPSAVRPRAAFIDNQPVSTSTFLANRNTIATTCAFLSTSLMVNFTRPCTSPLITEAILSQYQIVLNIQYDISTSMLSGMLSDAPAYKIQEYIVPGFCKSF
jgi:hypothetical protein